MTEMDNELGAVCEAVVQETKRITPMNRDEVRRIRLQVEDPAFRFVEGQTIGVVVPGPHDFGNKYHMRRYSIASAREVAGGEALEFELLVRRCFYLDEVSGERYPGIASNYLCDAPPGARVAISGPYRSPFKMPQDPRANLLMIGTGTGVAPFRAFIQYIYKHHPDWQGKVRLFYGARTGMDLFYLNDQEDDLANYYDEKSFRAFKGLISRPLASDDQALRDPLQAHAAEAWELMQDPMTHVYVAGLGKVVETLDGVMASAAGTEQAWQAAKERLRQEGRWSELIYN